MLEFKSLEASLQVTANGQPYFLTEEDIDDAFCETADLIDNRHEGPAMVELAGSTTVLEQSEWEALYDYTETHIHNFLHIHKSAGMSGTVIH